MLVEDKILCLAHGPIRTPRETRQPPAWCERLGTCTRHQRISVAPFAGSHTVMTRVCSDGEFNEYLPVDRDGVDSEGGEA